MGVATKEKRKHGLLVEEPILEKEGMVVGTKFKANPAVHIEFNAAKTCKAFLTEFGMTPSSRSRIMAVPGENEADNKWKDLL